MIWFYKYLLRFYNVQGIALGNDRHNNASHSQKNTDLVETERPTFKSQLRFFLCDHLRVPNFSESHLLLTIKWKSNHSCDCCEDSMLFCILHTASDSTWHIVRTQKLSVIIMSTNSNFRIHQQTVYSEASCVEVVTQLLLFYFFLTWLILLPSWNNEMSFFFW